MSNLNTKRRVLYLPPELDEFLIEESVKTGAKINNIVLTALNEYRDNNLKNKKIAIDKEKIEFKSKVMVIIEEYLTDNRFD